MAKKTVRRECNVCKKFRRTTQDLKREAIYVCRVCEEAIGQKFVKGKLIDNTDNEYVDRFRLEDAKTEFKDTMDKLRKEKEQLHEEVEMVGPNNWFACVVCGIVCFTVGLIAGWAIW